MIRIPVLVTSFGFTLATLFGAPGTAQQAAPQPTPQPRAQEELLRAFGQSRDPLADAFFPPELVMQHQQAIALTGEQRTAIVNIIAESQPRFIEAQWALQPETAALAELVRGDRVNEQQVLTQIDRVLDIERQIKRLQIEMLIRIKNQLTLEQQQQLARLGGVRLRGLLDPNRAKGMGIMPAGEYFKFTPGSDFPPGLDFSLGTPRWMDLDTSHWTDFESHFDQMNPVYHEQPLAPSHWTPLVVPPPGGGAQF
jgi:Spy/CpxP family protein refolding chaperone